MLFFFFVLIVVEAATFDSSCIRIDKQNVRCGGDTFILREERRSASFALDVRKLIEASRDGEQLPLPPHKRHHQTIPFGTREFYEYVGICIGLTVTAGTMSGLTLALLSISVGDLKVVIKAGESVMEQGGPRPGAQDDHERVRLAGYARRVMPLVEDHHLLLVTLLLANAAAMEALPIFLDRLVSPTLAIVISVTAVLLFGEVIPQAVCSRHGLAIGAKLSFMVWILEYALFVVAWPIGKVLDATLPSEEGPFYRRTELAALVKVMEEEKGVDRLQLDEGAIIRGALHLSTSLVATTFTPLAQVFMLPLDAVLDETTMDTILETGHSRIPVYLKDKKNIVGVILVKALIKLRPDDKTPVTKVMREVIPHFSVNERLYHVLDRFQRGTSHISAVVDKMGYVAGIITLEDVIEKMIGREIYDEFDRHREREIVAEELEKTFLVEDRSTERPRAASLSRKAPELVRTGSYAAINDGDERMGLLKKA